MLSIYIFFFLFQTGLIWSSKIELKALMPDVSPQTPDLYLCHQVKLDEDKSVYITEFEAHSTSQVAHHILLYACAEPAEEETWNCGEMSHKSKKSQFNSGPICRGKQSIVFAWALDAPKLVLPKDVGFKLGGDTDNKYLVLQVHYANVDKFMDGSTDDSGIIIKGQTEPVSKLAGVYIVGTGGRIESHHKETFEAACDMSEDVTFYPFAYRAHAHKLGIVNSGYLVRNEGGRQTWTEIGRRSPKLPQMFYPVSNEVTVRKGDVIAARCTMENDRDHTVRIGSTGEDEMCNFYIMYYVDGKNLLKNNICWSPGPPFFHFGSLHMLDTSAIPKDISEVPKVQQEELERIDAAGGLHGGHNMKEPVADVKHEHLHGVNTMKEDQVNPDSMHHQGHSSSKYTDKIIQMVAEQYRNMKSKRKNVDSDEFEDNLAELEKAYLVKQILRRLDLE